MAGNRTTGSSPEVAWTRKAWVLIIGAGIVSALALVFHVQGWGSMPGNSCGGKGRYSPPCPEGTTPILLLAFLFTVVGYGLGMFAFSGSGSVRFGRRAAVVLAVGAAVGAWPGWLAADWMLGS
ncbi:hypothetical protein [Streptomyces sp. SID3212]|uniref:hypothetical protein n=1 Tax=Streptomyces sp. SID3212 TaxID=2690259 RepID=UPI00136934CC|nr:hypothetical protein [Streptomyces sp. SID3212]MYV55596.1 hypothetical protein [Streptomyces sp. SID3212]